MHGISLSETHGKSYITPEWRLANWLNIYRSNEYLSFCSHQWVSLEAWKQRYFLYKIICFNKHAYVVDGIFFSKVWRRQRRSDRVRLIFMRKEKIFSNFDLIGKCLQSCSWVYDDGLFSDRLMHLYMQQMKVLQNYLSMCYIKR